MQNKDLVKLIKRCKKQDSKAQELVYDRYYKAMYNTSLRILQDAAQAEDAMQEAFITAFEKLPDLNEAVTFSKWLKLIVINKSLNQLKKEKRFCSFETMNVVDDTEEEYEVMYQSKNNKPDVTRLLLAMNELKENYRVLLSLHYIEGYDYEEIVAITGLTNANCRAIISRAKKSLKKKLGVCTAIKN